MTNTSHQLVTERLAAVAEDLGLSFADDQTFANQGSYRFYYESLELAGEIAYSFQPGYVAFTTEGKSSPVTYYAQLGTKLADLEEYLRAEQ